MLHGHCGDVVICGCRAYKASQLAGLRWAVGFPSRPRLARCNPVMSMPPYVLGAPGLRMGDPSHTYTSPPPFVSGDLSSSIFPTTRRWGSHCQMAARSPKMGKMTRTCSGSINAGVFGVQHSIRWLCQALHLVNVRRRRPDDDRRRQQRRSLSGLRCQAPASVVAGQSQPTKSSLGMSFTSYTSQASLRRTADHMLLAADSGTFLPIASVRQSRLSNFNKGFPRTQCGGSHLPGFSTWIHDDLVSSSVH